MVDLVDCELRPELCEKWKENKQKLRIIWNGRAKMLEFLVLTIFLSTFGFGASRIARPDKSPFDTTLA